VHSDCHDLILENFYVLLEGLKRKVEEREILFGSDEQQEPVLRVVQCLLELRFYEEEIVYDDDNTSTALDKDMLAHLDLCSPTPCYNNRISILDEFTKLPIHFQ
jgi:hypothetical protein